MLDTITRYMAGLAAPKDAYFLSRPINALGDRYSSCALNSAGLVINAGSAAFPKIGAADFYAVASGVLVKIAAGTALTALTGINVTAANFNVACYFVDSASTVTVLGGTQATTLAGVKFPQFPVGKALIGLLVIPGAFTGGTTALDAVATVYISPFGAFDPTVLV